MRYSSSQSNSQSNILNRRYELPTCLLEVWTERSPLSDWQSQFVAQNLRFRLHLTHSKKTIKGNQQQITNLIETVTAYCDRWLAQDDFDSLQHEITISKLPKLHLSTLQLFDLYESLEICADELVILPNLVLEVPRLNLNWLKIIASAIALLGVSIGTIRLITSPFGEQPSYQIASTPDVSDSKNAAEKAVTPPSRSQDSAKVKVDSSSSSASLPKSNPTFSESKSPAAIAPMPSQADPSRLDSSQANQSRANHQLEKIDKVAIAPQGGITAKSSEREPIADNLPALSDGTIAQPRRLETPQKDAFSQSPAASTESLKPQAAAPAAPSVKIAVPESASRAASENIATSKIKVVQIQSELPSDVTTSLVQYLQSQTINTSNISATGTIAFDLDIVGDRIIRISSDQQGSTLTDIKAIAELKKIILNWRSASSVIGKVRIVIGL